LPWFAGGFLFVFLGMLLFATVTAMHPSGQFAVRYSLWQYYGVEIPRLFGPSYLGPASDFTSFLAMMLGQHLLASLAGGSVAAGVGWWLRKREGAGSDQA
jgi:hypothetical protein